MTARRLGPIVSLQVQRDVVKHRGVGYDPGPIVVVERAEIGPGGMLGLADGAWVVDSHHAAHPASRAGGRRPLSIGFTAHYGMMAERFGGIVTPGVAGENIIVDCDERVFEADLAGTVVIRTSGGDVELENARVAAPCAEFTSFLLRLSEVAPKRDLGDDVAFLEDGMRGFVLSTGHLQVSHPVAIGDEVWVRPG